MNFFKKQTSEKTRVQIAWEMYEHVFGRLKNGKSHESNKHPVGHPNRVEHDINEIEKAHLDLLKTKIDIELAEEQKNSNEALARKVFWLNVVLVLLSFVIAIAALLELRQ